ncbi:unnamed protein product [Rotaria socialis]|uniref:Uncharacterized protein n=1 Tax=Rotaria socialis TaxID=392032 RepID=A0A818IXQ7_9BILA|nr:unnamed protein product [Rotaria socialis]CAF4388070.1 unnamed protein product [Rotaria socialis]
MSQLCPINKCARTSRGLCDCCQKNLCLQHLSEHNALLVAELNPFTDEINALGNRLSTLNIQNITSNHHQKLQQWRDDCFKKINYFFERKCQEIDQLINEKVEQHRKQLNEISLKIADRINAQETTRKDIDSLNSSIAHLKIEMNKIEQICFTIDTRPLVIDDSFVVIQKTTEHELDLSTLSRAYRTIDRPEDSFLSLADNDQHLLLHLNPNLCLFDREMNKVNQVLWNQLDIQDMCWSSTLDQFIVLGRKTIFLISENTMSINEVKAIREGDWLSCTCSDTVLFVSTNELGSSIVEFALVPTMKSIKKWKSPITCTKDNYIDGIVYKNENLALMIMNDIKKSLRIELRSASNLDYIWSIPLDVTCVKTIPFRCCALTCNEWLIVDYETEQMLQITKDGEIKTILHYYPRPYRATLFEGNKLVIVTTDSVLLHSIQ